MGGTFDPIHIGHLILAEQAVEQLGLDTVLFVTAADPPHKPGQVKTPAEHRFEMARLALEGNERFECSRLELDRPGPSYTVETIRQVLGSYPAETSVYLLLGADEAAQLMTWREPRAIAELAIVVVANRPSSCVADAVASLPEDVARSVVPLEMPGVDISSTDIRERVRSGRSIRYLVPESVRYYILRNSIYRGLE